MKKLLVIAVILAVLIPAAVWAQEEVTLEKLADIVAGLTERVERMETLWDGPGAVQVDETTCSIGRPQDLQDETALRYKEQFDEWVDMDSVWLIDVRHSMESGHTILVFADSIWSPDYSVAETWDGCTFVGSSDWWEVD